MLNIYGDVLISHESQLAVMEERLAHLRNDLPTLTEEQLKKERAYLEISIGLLKALIEKTKIQIDSILYTKV